MTSGDVSGVFIQTANFVSIYRCQFKVASRDPGSLLHLHRLDSDQKGAAPEVIEFWYIQRYRRQNIQEKYPPEICLLATAILLLFIEVCC
jgi:hypothetical protein